MAKSKHFIWATVEESSGELFLTPWYCFLLGNLEKDPPLWAHQSEIWWSSHQQSEDNTNFSTNLGDIGRWWMQRCSTDHEELQECPEGLLLLFLMFSTMCCCHWILQRPWNFSVISKARIALVTGRFTSRQKPFVELSAIWKPRDSLASSLGAFKIVSNRKM